MLQVSAQGLLPRRGSHSVLPREDHVHNDDRTLRLQRRQPVRPIPSAWGVDAMGGSVVGGRTAQRSRGGVTSELLRRSPPHLLVQQCEQQTVHHWQNMGGDGVWHLRGCSTCHTRYCTSSPGWSASDRRTFFGAERECAETGMRKRRFDIVRYMR